ncbi:MAG: hypothetical protein HUN04_21670 [Desulfobacter sp.]|nr:MAG: hypothetical protein HUN04_21670 [Desulfobacter sp.]
MGISDSLLGLAIFLGLMFIGFLFVLIRGKIHGEKPLKNHRGPAVEFPESSSRENDGGMNAVMDREALLGGDVTMDSNDH